MKMILRECQLAVIVRFDFERGIRLLSSTVCDVAVALSAQLEQAYCSARLCAWTSDGSRTCLRYLVIALVGTRSDSFCLQFIAR